MEKALLVLVLGVATRNHSGKPRANNLDTSGAGFQSGESVMKFVYFHYFLHVDT